MSTESAESSERSRSAPSITHVRPDGTLGATTNRMPAMRTRHGPVPLVGSTVAPSVTERRVALVTRAVPAIAVPTTSARTAYVSPSRGTPLGATRTSRAPLASTGVPAHVQ